MVWMDETMLKESNVIHFLALDYIVIDNSISYLPFNVFDFADDLDHFIIFCYARFA